MTKSKETIYQESMMKEIGSTSKMTSDEIVYRAMDIWGKQEAIEFFIWYGSKMAGFIQYINDIRPRVRSEEIEEKIVEFEGQSIEKLYELYQKSKQP